MRPASYLLIGLLALAGCDKLTGKNPEQDQKSKDAVAVGYACRVSQKAPEACMKENEAQSPALILDGWKKADQDIKNRAIDANMINPPPLAPESAAAHGEGKDEEAKKDEKAEEKPVEDKKPVEPPSTKVLGQKMKAH